MLLPYVKVMAETQLFLDKKKAATDHIYFADRLLSFVEFPYQAKINWAYRKILIRGGRRTGKDTVIVNRRIIPFMWTWYCPVKKVKLSKAPVIGVYAPGWEEADTFMEIFRDAVYGTPLEKSIVVDNKFEIKLSNGAKLLCRIASKTATGKRGRGFDLLYFTESEYIADSEYAAIRPSRLIGSAPEILASSPNGDENFCARAEDSGLYQVHIWKTSDSPLVSKEDLEEEKLLCTDIEYRQEYEAERISGLGQAIPDKLIQKMYENKKLELLEKGIPGKTYVAGVDLGRRRDKTTVYVLDVEFPECTIVYYKEFTMDKDDPRFWVKVIDHLIWLADVFLLQKMRVDQTGIGDVPVVELKRVMAEKSIPCVVEGVDFSYAFKHKWEGLINQAILKFERYELHGPFIRKLCVQLRSMRWNPKTKMYEARGPSPDHVMGLFLALGGVATTSHYFGTASNKNSQTNPLVEEENINIDEKISSGYALKASEIKPETNDI